MGDARWIVALLLLGCSDPVAPRGVGRTSAALRVGPEVATDPPIEQLAASPFFPAIARSDDGVELVLWVDGRFLGTDVVVGSRVAADGEIMDPLGLALGQSHRLLDGHVIPVVASDGASFLAAWLGPSGDRLIGHVIGQDGAIGPEVRLDASGVTPQTRARLTHGAGGYLATWIAPVDGVTRAIARRFDAAGSPASGEIDVSPVVFGVSCREADVAAGAGGYLLVMTCGGKGWVRKLSASGILGDATELGKAAHGVAHDGAGFLVGVEDDGSSLLAVQRLDGAGAPVGPRVTLVDEACAYCAPQIAAREAAGGGGFQVTWYAQELAGETFTTVATTSVSPSGEVGDTVRFGEHGESPSGQVATATGFAFVALATLEEPYVMDVVVRRTLPTGAVAPGLMTLLSRQANAQLAPTLAAGTGGALWAWVDGRDPDGIRIARLAADASVIDDVPLDLHMRRSDPQHLVRLGDRVLGLNRDAREKASIIEQPAGVLTADTVDVPAVGGRVLGLAGDGARAFAIVSRGSGGDGGLDAVWLDADAAVDGDVLTLADAAVAHASVIRAGDGYAVVLVAGARTELLRVGDDRTLAGPFAVDLATPTLTSIALAASSPDHLILVRHRADHAIEVAAVDVATGAAGPATALGSSVPAPAPSNLLVRTVGAARIGDHVLVAWLDDRDGDRDIRAARVDGATGEVLDPGGFAVIDSAMDERDVVLASQGDDQAILAFGRFDTAPDRMALRVGAVLLSPAAAATDAGPLDTPDGSLGGPPDAGGPGPPGDGGCGCRSSPTDALWPAGLTLLVAALARRRRRSVAANQRVTRT